MFFLKLLSKFIKVLRSAASPSQIAWGFALGAIVGLTPFWSLHNFIVFILLIVLHVNGSSAVLAFTICSFFAWVFDPIFHAIGFTVLVRVSVLESVWTALYNLPIAPLTRFNNTVVMGSLLCSLVLLAPNYFLFKWFVIRYRTSWNETIQRWKITQMLKANKLIQFYFKVREMKG